MVVMCFPRRFCPIARHFINCGCQKMYFNGQKVVCSRIKGRLGKKDRKIWFAAGYGKQWLNGNLIQEHWIHFDDHSSVYHWLRH